MNENIKTFLIAPEQTPDGEKCYVGSKRIVYTGEAVSVDGADIPHGKGKCVWELEGAVYEGDWVDGKMSGHGVFDSASLYVIPYESRKPRSECFKACSEIQYNCPYSLRHLSCTYNY